MKPTLRRVFCKLCDILGYSKSQVRTQR